MRLPIRLAYNSKSYFYHKKQFDLFGLMKIFYFDYELLQIDRYLQKY